PRSRTGWHRGDRRRDNRGLLPARRALALQRRGLSASRERPSPQHARAERGRHRQRAGYRRRRGALMAARTLSIVLYEGLGSTPLDAPVRTAALAALLERGYKVARVSQGAVPAPDAKAVAVLGRFHEAQPSVAE